MKKFELVSEYKPMGDQPEAIESLVEGIKNGDKGQSLLGVTGSGKTFTIANVIEKVQKPTLVLAHNKTLAAQLCSEFREFFPNNAVEYFVSYYDYYQPEAYVPTTDTYIDKDSSINDEIDKLRHSATSSLLERNDVIIVSSVSCIYSLGSPEEYEKQMISLRVGMEKSREEVIEKLVSIQYQRNDLVFERNKFRVRGDVIEIMPANTGEDAIRIEFFGDEIDRITKINTLTGEVKEIMSYIAIFPATHYVLDQDHIENAIAEIERQLDERIKYFEDNNKLIEAQRIRERTKHDIEMIREVGYCSGIENYSSIFSGRGKGATPYTLFDFFPDDFLLVVDESHVMLPQIKAMFGGDYSRKKNLVDYGFRLPCAFDNRPMKFEEFEEKINQAIFVSATPAQYEKEHSSRIVQQVIRPTGLLDPEIDVRPIDGQIEDLFSEITKRIEKNERVLVTTLTKKMAEDLAEYLENLKIKVRYMHHAVDTMERMEIIRDLRLGKIDVLVGINLLREGLDIPEVSLVAILDADKEGFLRSETSLIQTIGRAARNAEGKVIMYADVVTDSMYHAISETNRRRAIQKEFNEKNGIVPKTVKKDIRKVIEISGKTVNKGMKKITAQERDDYIKVLEERMKEAARLLEFEQAAKIRDELQKLKGNKK